MYSASANQVQIATGGVVRFQVFSAGIEGSAQVRGLAAGAATPTFCSNNDTNSGLYFLGLDQIGLCTNATARLEIGATGVWTLWDGTTINTGTTTGTRIGTSSAQKIGLWNTTPIVQPTTAVAAATFVANTSGIANDTATFDGYTIGQIVKALRNMGALA